MQEMDIDKLVAERIRRRRVRLGLSQKDVAQHIGVSYQQVQKYEKGVCRIGAGTLMKLSTLLQVAPSHFFSDTSTSSPARLPESNSGRTLGPMEQQLLADFAAIEDPQVRANIVHLVASMVASGTYRRHPRIVPSNTTCKVWEATLGCFEARIENLSLSGAALLSDLIPECGSSVRVGTRDARIVRVFDSGFAVEFDCPLDSHDFNEGLIL